MNCYLFLLTMLFYSCNKKETENAIKKNINLVWKTHLNSSIIGYGITMNLKNNVMFYNSENNERSFVFLDKINGKINGKWNNWFDKKPDYGDNGIPYFDSNNRLVSSDKNGSYIINTENFQTIKRNTSKYYTSGKISGCNNLYAYSKFPDDGEDGKGWSTLILGNTITGEEKVILNMRNSPTNSDVEIGPYIKIDNSSNDTSLCFQLLDYSLALKKETCLFYCQYSTTTKQLIKIPLNYRGINLSYIYTFNNTIILNDGTLGIDKKTYQKKWQIETNIGKDGFTLDETSGIIYASMQAIDPTKPLGYFLKAIDANTGNIIWQKEIGNHCTKPFIMNGVVYTTVVGLLAFDAKTGADVFRVSTASLNPDDWSDFDGHTVIGDGERIYVSSGMYAYCLKGN